MHEQVKGAAWALGLWGVLSVILGVLILAWPGITLKILLVILGVYLLAAGVTMFFGSLIHHASHWVGGMVIGAISALAGIYVFANPQISTLAILTVIAIWAIVVGAMEIVAGFETRDHRWWLILSGIVYALFGLYIFAQPAGGALAIIWLIGLSVIVGGVLTAAAGLKLGQSR